MIDREPSLGETSHTRRSLVRRATESAATLLAFATTAVGTIYAIDHAKDKHNSRAKQNKAIFANLHQAVQEDGFGSASKIDRNIPVIGKVPVATLAVSTDCMLDSVELDYVDSGKDIKRYRFYLSEDSAVIFEDKKDLQENILDNKECLPDSDILVLPPDSLSLP